MDSHHLLSCSETGSSCMTKGAGGLIIIIIIEGLSLLQSIPPTTADKLLGWCGKLGGKLGA